LSFEARKHFLAFFFDEVIMENEMLVNLVWFLSGALSFKLISYILGLGSAINLFTQVLVGCLMMIKKVDDQMLISIEARCDLMKKEEMPIEQIENTRNMNTQAHELWRTMMIAMIHSCCPSSIQNILKFKDWDSAMELLKK